MRANPLLLGCRLAHRLFRRRRASYHPHQPKAGSMGAAALCGAGAHLDEPRHSTVFLRGRMRTRCSPPRRRRWKIGTRRRHDGSDHQRDHVGCHPGQGARAATVRPLPDAAESRVDSSVRLRLQRKDLAIPFDIVVAREPNKAILEVRAEVGKLAIEAIGGGQAFEFSHLRDKMNDWTSSTFTNAREGGQLERER